MTKATDTYKLCVLSCRVQSGNILLAAFLRTKWSYRQDGWQYSVF